MKAVGIWSELRLCREGVVDPAGSGEPEVLGRIRVPPPSDVHILTPRTD